MIGEVQWDEGIVYKSNGKYYLHWVGLGKTRKLSNKLYKALEKSSLRIDKDEGNN
jgi:hypothetical protein